MSETACFVCGATSGTTSTELEATKADGSDPREVSLWTCAECRAELRRQSDQRALGLGVHGSRARVWYAIDLFGGMLVLAAGFFIAVWQGWAPGWLSWGGWACVALSVPAAMTLFVFETRHARTAPARWAASEEKKRYDAHAAAVRAKLDAAVHAAASTEHRVDLDDAKLIDPITWKPE